jgi:hypothetical protein
VTGEESGGASFAMEARPRHRAGARGTSTAGPGDFVNVPRGTVHCFHNSGAGTARMILAFTPAGMEGFFEETLEPAPNGALEAPENHEDVSARYFAAAPRCGLEFL